jgi:hypothetical protein
MRKSSPGKLFMTFSVIMLLLVGMASVQNHFIEFDRNPEFPLDLMGSALHISRDVPTDDKGGVMGAMEYHHVDIYVNNDRKYIYVKAILYEHEYNPADDFRVLFMKDDSDYRLAYYDSKIISAGITNYNENGIDARWEENLADEQFVSFENWTIFPQRYFYNGISDQSIGGTLNFVASVRHTHPILGAVGNYTVNYEIPLKGDICNGKPIDLNTEPGKTIGMTFVWENANHYSMGYCSFEYTVRGL